MNTPKQNPQFVIRKIRLLRTSHVLKELLYSKMKNTAMVISTLTVAECDENTFQSRTKHFSGDEWAREASV